MDYITKNYNNLLSINLTRIFLLLITSVYIGYTLQPVPKVLNNLFDNSNLFKFLILFICGSTSLYPLDNNKLLYILISSILILILFNYLRSKDIKIIEKNIEK